MSSDGYFEDDITMDDAMFEALDAIEAAHNSPQKASSSKLPQPPLPGKSTLSAGDSFYDIDDDFDDDDIQILDQMEQYYQKNPNAPAITRTSSKGLVQTTLFGDVLRPETSAGPSKSHRPLPRQPSGQQSQKLKKWDHTAFAKSGMRLGNKGKQKAKNNEEDEDEEPVEFEHGVRSDLTQLTLTHSVVASAFHRPPPPMKIKPDLLEAKHWIYPLNNPKRDYQFNIVRHCLFENTIVALPTGMGKTFVAGVIMLNFYRWFPDGNIVFLAPTKPLVNQQVEACHKSCGIPGSDAIVLTGDITRTTRTRFWQEKRVFYMTPQTFRNDLVSGNCDPLDIVLLVLDEAHHASGDHAYNQIVRFMMAKNPHFRVLALTATPGGNPDTVQNMVDGLHISRIEIRDDESLDLRAYIHEKRLERHIIPMSAEVNAIRDKIVKVMESLFQPIKRLYGYPVDLKSKHFYFFQARQRDLKVDEKYAYPYLVKLSSLARIMGYLIEGTIQMCYSAVQDLAREPDSENSKKSKEKKPLRSDPLFQNLVVELEEQKRRGFTTHPKMEKMKDILITYFGARMSDSGTGDGDVDDGAQESRTEPVSKAMVFVTNRQVVDEIIEELETHKPLIKASRFVGQGTDKQGKKGLAQKEQLDIIRRFKEGDFNVLVATSIGEEGLDIGEVDLIVCYDVQKTPIRMLQRLGRTGRKRDGTVHLLLAEGREEQNMDKAKASHKEVQKTIVRGDHLELYADVERLLPDNIQPQCLEKVMEIQEYVQEEGKKRTTKEDGGSKRAPKRKRNDDIGRNIPMGASTGFVTVSQLLVKGGAKKRKPSKPITAEEFDQAGEDDEVDAYLEAGLDGPPLKKSKSASAATKSKSKSSSSKGNALRKSKTLNPKQSNKKEKEKSDLYEFTSSQFAAKGVDDDDDRDIERGLLRSPRKAMRVEVDDDDEDALDVTNRGFLLSPNQMSSHVSPIASPSPSRNASGSLPRSSGSIRAVVGDAIDISDSEDDVPPKRDEFPKKRSDPANTSNIAWLLEDDDDNDNDNSLEIVDSSPLVSRNKKVSRDSSVEIVDSPVRPKAPRDDDYLDDVNLSSPLFKTKKAGKKLSDPGSPTDADLSVEFLEGPSGMPVKNSQRTMLPPPLPARLASFTTASSLMRKDVDGMDSPPRHAHANTDDHLKDVDFSSPLFLTTKARKNRRDLADADRSVEFVEGPSRSQRDMPPPLLPARFMSASDLMPVEDEAPEPSFMVRAPGKKRARVPTTASDDVDSPAISRPRRLHKRGERGSPTAHRAKKTKLPAKNNPLYDVEAVHSGDEVSEGSSDAEDDVETESDRRFVEELPETQVSPSYDQTQAYRRSLFTQAPGAPVFANGPIRNPRGAYRIDSRLSNRRREDVSSSPPQDSDDLPDEYAFGSFVVDDDADISYEA
ncbi:hypothetical protein D9758_002380 [Tetrapyrgos nigripes]|uniref:ATP-dependent DNA helicase n=1 Tax=Tetrapyrgos nigripes TaxID=182062 RepID=A0A8H5LT31_9AGAR|nr:hypothetical protein D9758_002380 [Tetrapyrgos nigripes]